MNIREIVLKHLAIIVEEHSPVHFPDNVSDDKMLEDFWIDSVAFARLIGRIEEEVGYIPLSLVEGAFFPETIGELVALYEDGKG